VKYEIDKGKESNRKAFKYKIESRANSAPGGLALARLTNDESWATSAAVQFYLRQLLAAKESAPSRLHRMSTFGTYEGFNDFRLQHSE
jgi:hypothetical protein